MSDDDDDLCVQGKETMLAALRTDPDLLKQLEDRTKEVMKTSAAPPTTDDDGEDDPEGELYQPDEEPRGSDAE